MIDQVLSWWSGSDWWNYALRIASFYLIAWLVKRLSGRLAERVVRLNAFAASGHRTSLERRATLSSIIASAITFLAFVTATVLTLAQFIDTTTLVWIIGLFSAAFGLGARPVISDFLTGFSLMFEDTFAVGDKVEILGVEGVVESVSLRVTQMRAPTGELFTMPNGEIRVVRNFSRGRHSLVTVKLKVEATDLEGALAVLDSLGSEAVSLLPNLLEPWLVLSESGAIGQHTELTLVARARFGKAAEMQPRLLALVHERLSHAGIALAD